MKSLPSVSEKQRTGNGSLFKLEQMCCDPGSCDTGIHQREAMESQILQVFKKRLAKDLFWKFTIFLDQMTASDHSQSYDAMSAGICDGMNPHAALS